MGRTVGHIEDEAVESLIAYDWPGNIRELENVIERAVVLCEGPALTLDDLPTEIRRPGVRRPRPPQAASARSRSASSRSLVSSPTSTTFEAGSSASDRSEGEPEAVAFERHRLLDALEQARGNKSVTAKLLGMPRSTFFSKLKKHGLATGG